MLELILIVCAFYFGGWIAGLLAIIAITLLERG